MAQTISCPSCRRRLLLPEELIGRLIRCPTCKTEFQGEGAISLDIQAALPAPLPAPLPMSLEIDEVPPCTPVPTSPAPEPEILDILPADPPLAFHPRAPLAPRPRGRRLVPVMIALASACCIMLAFLGTFFFVQLPERYADAPAFVPVEWPEQRQQEVVQAFQGEPAPLDEESTASLKELFGGIGTAFQNRDGNALIGHFDLERMLDEFMAQGMLPAHLRGQRDALLRGMRTGLQRGLTQNAALMQWHATEIRSARKLPSCDLVVIARHRDDANLRLKMRWWVTRRGNAWRVYDYEDLDMGMRASALFGSIAGFQQGDILRMARDVQHLQEAMVAIVSQDDADTAAKKLQRIAGTQFPKPLEAVREVIAALVHNSKGDYQQALDALDRANRILPDMPLIDFLKGSVCNRLGRYDQALTHLTAYQKLLGDDANLCMQLGLALHHLERYADAQAQYRKALDDDPTMVDAYLHLVRALADKDAHDDLGPRFVKLGNHVKNFEAVVQECGKYQDGMSLEPVALAMQKLQPRHAPADFQLALARIWQGKIADAVTPFRTALAKDAGGRKKFVQDFAKALAAADKAPLDQYEEAGKALEQPGGARLTSAEMNLVGGVLCVRSRQWEKGMTRLRACQDELAADAKLRIQYAVALHFLDRFPEACVEYRRALDQDPTYFEALRNLIQALPPEDERKDLGARFVKLGDPLIHFDALAETCRDHRQWQVLEALAREVQKLEPKNPAADLQLAQAKIGQNQIDQALVHLNAAVAKDPEKRKTFYKELAGVLVRSGKAVDAYAKLGQTRDVFALLAGELMQAYRMDDLRQLVAAHATQHADDPLLPFYRGELHVQDGAYAEADKEFSAGLARRPDAATLEQFRRSRVTARYHTGNALAAYREIGPVEDTFQQLAGLAFYRKDTATLEKLLALHAAKHPNGLELARFRFRLKVQQHQPAEAIALYQAALKKAKDDEDREDLTDDFLGDMARAGHALAAYEAAPDARTAFQRLANELDDEDAHAQLTKLIERHRQAHADDPWLIFHQGTRLVRAKAWNEAIQVLGAGMKHGPDDSRGRLRYQYVTAMYHRDKGLQAYREADDKSRDMTFNQLANLLLDARKGKELQELVEAHRPHATAQPGELLFCDACCRILQKKPAEAIPLIQQAHDKETRDYRRHDYVRRFVLLMKGAGRTLEGYRAAPDKALAFATLAERLVSDKNAKELAALIQAAAGVPAPAPLALYQGKLLLLQGKVQEAEQTFAAALPKAPREFDYQLRSSLFEARIRLGKTADTYREFGPESFDLLANECVEQKNAAALASLVAARRQQRPDDPDLVVRDVDICWLKEDFAGAWKLLSAQRDGVLARPRHRWKTNDYLVRCLVKLQRFPEALQEAERVNKDPENRNEVLLVLVHAAAGDVAKTSAALEKKGRPWLLSACYRDRDLGPILKSDAFKEFRARFPEPTDDDDRE